MREGNGMHPGIGENGRQPNDFTARYWNEMRHAHFRRRAAANEADRPISPKESTAKFSPSLARMMHR